MDRPNIVLVVLDSARVDYLTKYSNSAKALAEEGVVFENAVAPARWSLPSHASIFSGKYPSEHGVYLDRGTEFTDLPLVNELKTAGYNSCGFSANLFASATYNFDEAFDYFHEPDRFRNSGLHPLEVAGETDYGGWRNYLYILSQALTHDNPGSSLLNFATAAAAKTGLVNGDNESAGVHKSAVKYLRDDSQSTEPFFLFLNYMNTHSPYKPSLRAQFSVGDGTIPPWRRDDLNFSLAKPPEFLDNYYGNNRKIDQERLNDLQKLYAAEVVDVDRYLKELHEVIDSYCTNETLLVITADHGQVLGEPEDTTGDRRMGHVETVNDHVLQVPLILYHPDLEPSVVEDIVELKQIYQVIENLVSTGEIDVDLLRPTDGIGISECLATGNLDYLSKSNIPDEVNQLQGVVHTVVGYLDEWKMVQRSNGEEYLFHDGKQRDLSECPAELSDTVQSHLEDVDGIQVSEEAEPVSESVQRRLEELGYR